MAETLQRTVSFLCLDKSAVTIDSLKKLLGDLFVVETASWMRFWSKIHASFFEGFFDFKRSQTINIFREIRSREKNHRNLDRFAEQFINCRKHNCKITSDPSR